MKNNSLARINISILISLFLGKLAVAMPTHAANTISIESHTSIIRFIPAQELKINKTHPIRKKIAKLFCQTTNSLGICNCKIDPSLFNQMESIFFYPEIHIALLQKSKKTLGALGFLINTTNNKELGITWFAVNEKYQRQGNGTHLLGKTLEQFPEYSATLSCFSNNKSAQDFYLKNGFQQSPSNDKDFVIFTKPATDLAGNKTIEPKLL